MDEDLKLSCFSIQWLRSAKAKQNEDIFPATELSLCYRTANDGCGKATKTICFIRLLLGDLSTSVEVTTPREG